MERLILSGAPLIDGSAGTDAGTPLNPHGSIVPELELMVKHGMTPLDRKSVV